MLPDFLAPHFFANRCRVADYIAACNTHYYATRDPFGTAGDFITAPEISQLFGEMIGAWCIDVWQKLGAPASFNLVELGPGRGTLMMDILRTATLRPDFVQAASVHLVEQSPLLKQCQHKTIQHHTVHWHNNTHALPAGPTLFIANEFFDALPITQYVATENDTAERFISCENNNLSFAPAGPVVREESPISQHIMQHLVGHLHAHRGAALIIDYGHHGPITRDTLQAVKNHRYANVLENAGDCDITAHVDFMALNTIAASSIHTLPITTQGHFLLQLGIHLRAAALLKNATPAQANDIQTALHRLTDTGEMGDLFKVLICHHGLSAAPAG